MFLFFFLIYLNCTISQGQAISINEVRKQYEKATEDKKICENLYSRLSVTDTESDVILMAYYGAVSAIMGNHTKEPAKKLKYFNAGRRLLEKSVHLDSTNIETRFLRLTIQANCPATLNYNKNISSDKTFILDHIEENKNAEMKKRIAGFLLNATFTSPEEKERLRKLTKE
jgi:hypothetical protein